jgi:Iron-sulfur cluster-binding domain
MKDIKDLVKNSKHFCILPWIHFHSWPDKRVLPCCIADSTKPYSRIKPKQSILEMMNSPEYKEMRVKMLNDEPIDTCKRCYDLETLGTWTMRQSNNDRRGMEFAHLVEQTAEDGSIAEFKMAYMDIRFSNICNMKCRSCGPACSSQWAIEHKARHGEGSLKQYFDLDDTVANSNKTGSFFKQLEPYLADVQEVYFAGGEILITPEHYSCLDYWIKNGLTEQVELTYTTNFSVLKYKNKDLLGYWKQFPNLKIWASLDAKGGHAEMIRKGTDWEVIEQNLRDIKTNVPHAQFQITPTISIWNVHAFPRFFDYLIDNELISRDTSPRWNLATNPWFANIQILPDRDRKTLEKLYTKYCEKYKDNIDIFNGFKMIAFALASGSENKGGILEFIKYNDELDDWRKEKLTDVVPELKKVFQWAKS